MLSLSYTQRKHLFKTAKEYYNKNEHKIKKLGFCSFDVSLNNELFCLKFFEDDDGTGKIFCDVQKDDNHAELW